MVSVTCCRPLLQLSLVSEGSIHGGFGGKATGRGNCVRVPDFGETTASCPTDDRPFRDAESRQSRQQRPALASTASGTRTLGKSPGGDMEPTALRLGSE